MENKTRQQHSPFRIAWTLAVLLCMIVSGERSASAQCLANEWAKLLASDGADEDHFGYSVAISGEVAVVGARMDEDNGMWAGSAYVYHLVDSGWQEEAKLLPADGAPEDMFGYSVSVSGDAILVGAPNDEDGSYVAGSAYVFRYDGSTWSEEAKLMASDGTYGKYFGEFVSISGDTAVIGSPADCENGPFAGAAYVFHHDGTDWVEQAKLLASDGVGYGELGTSVSISGDTILIGAPEDEYNGLEAGSAYVFRYDGSGWAEEAKLVPSDADSYGAFGYSVAISGDTAIVGDPDGGWQLWEGSAYVFRRVGLDWVEETKILASDGVPHAEFGRSVSITGDTALVGAFHDTENGYKSGSSYVYHHDGSEWIEAVKLLGSDGTSHDWFGWSVSISGDKAIVGAHYYDGVSDRTGAAYIFHGLLDFNQNDVLDICDIDFEGPVEIASIGEPTDVVSTDFTGSDGNDIAVAEQGAVPEDPGYLVLMLNDGTGLNFTKMSTAVGREPSAFAVGDFDGVNGPDAAVANAGDNDVTILLNDGNGAGTFQLPVDVPVGNYPSDIVAGDFNGDTHIDLAVANKDDNTITILVNDGDGAFTELTTFSVGSGPSGLAAAPLDAGGTIDLVVVNQGDDTAEIYLNNGVGGFILNMTIETDADPWVIDPEDIDNDTDNDMVLGNFGSDTIHILINDGEANFEVMTITVGQAPSSIDISDVDIDGDQDILVVADAMDSRAVRVLRNDLNDGTELDFTLFADLAENPNLKLTAAKDLNNNGLPDIIAVSGPSGGAGPRSEGSVVVLLNELPPPCPADLNGDNQVNIDDLFAVLAAWGPCDDCPEDLDDSGVVDIDDLFAILAAWGPCP